MAQPDGKKLFKANCSACHTTTDAKLIGPGLKGVSERWPDQEKLYAWIRNSSEFLKTGDAYANQLFNEYGKSPMSPFPNLTDEDIDAILGYIEAPVEAAPAAQTAAGEQGEAVAEDSGTSFYVLLGLGILFIILIVTLGGVGRALRNLINEKKGLPPVEGKRTSDAVQDWMYRNKKLTAIIVIAVVVGLLKGSWDYLLGVGVYTGYAPEQPIKFSHKIHAGENGINCVYCHSSAEKSKHAGIPSANVCMNCHKGITEGTTTGTEEISKIYEAIGYDPERADYKSWAEEKPIAWVKVHNLPDHVYFNHSQHVTVAGLECQTCHGEVEKMDVVEQFAPLTMGWCVDCHRENPVKDAGNGYYDEFHRRLTQDEEAMAKYMRSGKTDVDDGKLTVEEIGGLECAKCHY